MSIFLSIISALLLILSFPKPNLGFLAWVALVPWLFALQQTKPRRAFLLSYMVGVIFFSGSLYWVTYVSSLGFSILVLYLGLYFAVFGLFFSILNTQYSILNLLFIPCLWVALEYIRSHLFSGFGWALLGYSQYRFLPIIQISDVTGTYGVSFLIVLINVGIWQAMSRLAKKSLYPVLCTLFSVLLVLSYGHFKLNQKPEGKHIKLAVVQGNIPQWQKWDPEARDYILEEYIHLTEQAKADGPDIVIWPETSVPGYLEDDVELRKEISSLSQRISPGYLLVGTPHVGEERKIYNSATLLRQGEIVQRYDKLHLVPFGEFIPWPGFFSRFSFAELIGDFHPGKDYTVFEAGPGVKLGVLICFEDVFSYLARDFVRKGANILVNMTNDAWFRDSSEPYQHLQASVFRAVENRVPVVRSANTGVSCFISQLGEIEARVTDDSGKDVLVAGQKNHDVYTTGGLSSFYTAYGDIFAWFCIVITLITIVLKVKR